MAMLLYKQEKYDDAYEYYQRALAIKMATYGPNHHIVATVIHNMTAVLHAQGRLDECIHMYEVVLTTRVAALGPDHLDVRLKSTVMQHFFCIFLFSPLHTLLSLSLSLPLPLPLIFYAGGADDGADCRRASIAGQVE